MLPRIPVKIIAAPVGTCLLYTSDAADDLIGVDLGGRRIIKKKKWSQETNTQAESRR